jgi:hypothetical protein
VAGAKYCRGQECVDVYVHSFVKNRVSSPWRGMQLLWCACEKIKRGLRRHLRKFNVKNYFCNFKVCCHGTHTVQEMLIYITLCESFVNTTLSCLFIMKIKYNTLWNLRWKSYEMGHTYDPQVLYLDGRIMSRLTKYLQRFPHSLNWGDKINFPSGLVYIHVFILDFTDHRKFSALKLKSAPGSIPGPVMWDLW